MATFNYRGRNQKGTEVTGQIVADSPSQVATELSSQNITAISIQITTPKTESQTKKEGIGFSFFNRINMDEMIIFSRQMYSLTKAGIPITRAMRGLANTVKNPILKALLGELSNDLEKGHTLSSAMAKHSKVFNELYVSMIHVGENTGHLENTFQQMASYLELELKTTKNIKQAVRYPKFVIMAIAIAIGIINIFVIPAFKSVFESFGGQMPWQTQLLINISDFTLAWWHTILGCLVVVTIAFYRWRATDSGTMVWDKYKLKFPIVGSIFYKSVLGRFTRTFSIILHSGIPIEQGLSIVASAVGNRYIGSKIKGMRQGIERGEAFSQTAYQAKMFSPLVMQMLAVGEETGQVDEMLDEAASFYEQEVEYDLKNLTSAIEPILIIAIGIMVLILALGVFLPLWELSSTING